MDDAEASRNCKEAMAIMRQSGLSQGDKRRQAGAVLCKQLARDQDAAHRVLQFILKFQTDEERVEKASKRLNGVGFSKYDAPLCTKLAEKKVEWLSKRELRTCCKRAGKYVDQVRHQPAPSQNSCASLIS